VHLWTAETQASAPPVRPASPVGPPATRSDA
jgi:hypothetical protein